jgi:hypothetical protein
MPLYSATTQRFFSVVPVGFSQALPGVRKFPPSFNFVQEGHRTRSAGMILRLIAWAKISNIFGP